MNRYSSVDRYCYPGTDILINKFDLTDPGQLELAEKLIVAKNLLELEAGKILVGDFDLQHLQRIHRHLFQDIYEWAGEIRDVQIQKGSTYFCVPIYINDIASHLFAELKSENYLKALNIDDFSKRASYYLSEINILHPFREGNGRTQREFMRLLALKNGYDLDWTRITPDMMLESSIESVRYSYAFEFMFKRAIVNHVADAKIIDHYKKYEESVRRCH